MNLQLHTTWLKNLTFVVNEGPGGVGYKESHGTGLFAE